MSNDKVRAEFEAWWQGEHGSTLYCESAWRGWKASRAALVIELPRQLSGSADFMNGGSEMRRLFRDAIEAEGVQVK